MGLYESLVRPMAFLLPPETAHNFGMSLIAKGVVRAGCYEHPSLRQNLFGIEFANPLGLAAGFDKNAIAADHWHRLGFGFAELGTVTRHPQPGNPQPRLFRLPEDKALINRMGFNNKGAAAAAARLAASSPKLPIGINLGKSKITDLKDAPSDYQESFRLLQTHGDYFVVNVSSPNTPGLRTLQDKAPLLDIIAAIREVDAAKPLFVKIAPDLEDAALDEVIEVANESKLTGLIATNTTISREGLQSPNAKEVGGLSGRPVWTKSNHVLSHLRANCPKEMVLIGVGGIFTGDDLFEKFRHGANLCQLYTGWIYGGPASAPTILRRFVELMERQGISKITEIDGAS